MTEPAQVRYLRAKSTCRDLMGFRPHGLDMSMSLIG